MSHPVLTNTALSPQILAMLEPHCTVTVWQGMDTPPEIFAETEGLFVYGHPKIDGPVMDRMPKLRVISNFGVGVDHINLADAAARNIAVGNTPRLVDGATADLTFALLMAIARNLVVGDRYARGPEFIVYDPNILHGFDVHGATIGIVGMGNIGRQVARRAHGFDMRILYHNRHPDPASEAALGAEYLPLSELLAQADFVTLNVPLTRETRGMIGREQLRQMRPSAYLINVARGGVIDHPALVEALDAGWIAGAALDVTEPEPLPRDHPLLSMDNVIIAPHLGSATRQTRHNMARRAVDNLLAGLTGHSLPSRIA